MRDHGIEADSGVPSHDVLAASLVAERRTPGSHGLHLLMQALYATAARLFFQPEQLDI